MEVGRKVVSVLAGLAATAPGGCQDERQPLTRTVSPCSWSYFGDPRAVAHGDRVITGCVDTAGRTVVEDYDVGSGRRRLQTVFEPLEVDDHNNPSLVFFRDRLFVFSSPHSGYLYPRDRRSQVRYRVSARSWGEGGAFGAVRTVPLGRGCGLGYTYPNPVVAGGRLYLFMRGPCWAPYFTWTDDGVRWAPPRTLVQAPPARLQDGSGSRRVRPYAKYAPARDGSVLMTFSDGHPASFKSSLYFARLTGDRFVRADGSVIGTLADLPFRFEQLDRVHPYGRGAGRAWPMDVAADATGAPVVAYTALHGTRDTFRYGRWDGAQWRTHAVAAAGQTLFSYHNAGATLDHADPRRVVLSRTVHGQNEIELRRTDDHGATWTARPLTHGSATFNIRPVIPRGRPADVPMVVLYVSGRATSFREYDTAVQMTIDDR
jgi:hypothetical protein